MNYKNNHSIDMEPGAGARYLETLGISDIDSFIYKPKPTDYESPWLMPHMKEAVQAYHNCMEKGYAVFVQVDPDVDGFTSASEIINFTYEKFPNAELTYRLQDGKEHGLIYDKIPKKAQLIIVPDAGTNQEDIVKQLSEEGKTVIILDHHEFECRYNYNNVYVVNCQDNYCGNHCLSGAGVVYKFMQGYDEMYGGGDSYKKYQDLAALGILADAMDSRTLDNNAIIRNGLCNICNPMLKALIKHLGTLKVKNPNKPTKTNIA